MKTMRHWLWMAVCLMGLQATPVLASQTASLAACRIGCEQTLAYCEKKEGQKGHCPRRHGQCLQQCESPGKKDRRDEMQRRFARCEQSCDLNRTTCEEANPGNTEGCLAGRQSCVQRCK